VLPRAVSCPLHRQLPAFSEAKGEAWAQYRGKPQGWDVLGAMKL